MFIPLEGGWQDWRGRSPGGSVGRNAMKLGFHCARTYWIRGFTAFCRRRGAQHAPREGTCASPASRTPPGSPADVRHPVPASHKRFRRLCNTPWSGMNAAPRRKRGGWRPCRVGPRRHRAPSGPWIPHAPSAPPPPPGICARDHGDVTLPWSGAPRCDIAVVRRGRRAGVRVRGVTYGAQKRVYGGWDQIRGSPGVRGAGKVRAVRSGGGFCRGRRTGSVRRWRGCA